MRVSIVNCVSTARDMMAFSDRSLISHAGCNNWDYVIVKWLASPEVDEYLDRLPEIVESLTKTEGINVHVIEHKTDDSVGYVPNLRVMMNAGFVNTRIVGTTGYRTSDYTIGTLSYAEKAGATT